jgi:hypothetical protein
MATTTNFGWETPDDTDLVKDGAAAIRTALGGVDTSFVDLKGGTTDQLLMKASNTDLDFAWGGTWTTWTPTLGNITLGNGTVTARYQKIGKTVNFRFNITFGTTTAVTGGAHFFLPITPAYDTPCSIVVRDNGVAFYPLTGMVFVSGAYCDIVVGTASGTYVTQTSVNTTVPVVLGSTDNIYVSGTYEVA